MVSLEPHRKPWPSRSTFPQPAEAREQRHRDARPADAHWIARACGATLRYRQTSVFGDRYPADAERDNPDNLRLTTSRDYGNPENAFAHELRAQRRCRLHPRGPTWFTTEPFVYVGLPLLDRDPVDVLFDSRHGFCEHG
jgi:hypothetical protein